MASLKTEDCSFPLALKYGKCKTKHGTAQLAISTDKQIPTEFQLLNDCVVLKPAHSMFVKLYN